MFLQFGDNPGVYQFAVNSTTGHRLTDLPGVMQGDYARIKMVTEPGPTRLVIEIARPRADDPLQLTPWEEVNFSDSYDTSFVIFEQGDNLVHRLYWNAANKALLRTTEPHSDAAIALLGSNPNAIYYAGSGQEGQKGLGNGAPETDFLELYGHLFPDAAKPTRAQLVSPDALILDGSQPPTPVQAREFGPFWSEADGAWLSFELNDQGQPAVLKAQPEKDADGKDIPGFFETFQPQAFDLSTQKNWVVWDPIFNQKKLIEYDSTKTPAFCQYFAVGALAAQDIYRQAIDKDFATTPGLGEVIPLEAAKLVGAAGIAEPANFPHPHTFWGDARAVSLSDMFSIDPVKAAEQQAALGRYILSVPALCDYLYPHPAAPLVAAALPALPPEFDQLQSFIFTHLDNIRNSATSQQDYTKELMKLLDVHSLHGTDRKNPAKNAFDLANPATKALGNLLMLNGLDALASARPLPPPPYHVVRNFIIGVIAAEFQRARPVPAPGRDHDRLRYTAAEPGHEVGDVRVANLPLVFTAPPVDPPAPPGPAPAPLNPWNCPLGSQVTAQADMLSLALANPDLKYLSKDEIETLESLLAFANKPFAKVASPAFSVWLKLFLNSIGAAPVVPPTFNDFINHFCGANPPAGKSLRQQLGDKIEARKKEWDFEQLVTPAPSIDDTVVIQPQSIEVDRALKNALFRTIQAIMERVKLSSATRAEYVAAIMQLCSPPPYTGVTHPELQKCKLLLQGNLLEFEARTVPALPLAAGLTQKNYDAIMSYASSSVQQDGLRRFLQELAVVELKEMGVPSGMRPALAPVSASDCAFPEDMMIGSFAGGLIHLERVISASAPIRLSAAEIPINIMMRSSQEKLKLLEALENPSVWPQLLAANNRFRTGANQIEAIRNMRVIQAHLLASYLMSVDMSRTPVSFLPEEKARVARILKTLQSSPKTALADAIRRVLIPDRFADVPSLKAHLTALEAKIDYPSLKSSAQAYAHYNLAGKLNLDAEYEDKDLATVIKNKDIAVCAALDVAAVVPPYVRGAYAYVYSNADSKSAMIDEAAITNPALPNIFLVDSLRHVLSVYDAAGQALGDRRVFYPIHVPDHTAGLALDIELNPAAAALSAADIATLKTPPVEGITDAKKAILQNLYQIRSATIVDTVDQAQFFAPGSTRLNAFNQALADAFPGRPNFAVKVPFIQDDETSCGVIIAEHAQRFVEQGQFLKYSARTHGSVADLIENSRRKHQEEAIAVTDPALATDASEFLSRVSLSEFEDGLEAGASPVAIGASPTPAPTPPKPPGITPASGPTDTPWLQRELSKRFELIAEKSYKSTAQSVGNTSKCAFDEGELHLDADGSIRYVCPDNTDKAVNEKWARKVIDTYVLVYFGEMKADVLQTDPAKVDANGHIRSPFCDTHKVILSGSPEVQELLAKAAADRGLKLEIPVVKLANPANTQWVSPEQRQRKLEAREDERASNRRGRTP